MAGLVHATSASPLLVSDAVKGLEEEAKDTGHLPGLAGPSLSPIRSGVEQMYSEEINTEANDSFKVSIRACLNRGLQAELSVAHSVAGAWCTPMLPAADSMLDVWGRSLLSDVL